MLEVNTKFFDSILSLSTPEITEGVELILVHVVRMSISTMNYHFVTYEKGMMAIVPFLQTSMVTISCITTCKIDHVIPFVSFILHMSIFSLFILIDKCHRTNRSIFKGSLNGFFVCFWEDLDYLLKSF